MNTIVCYLGYVISAILICGIIYAKINSTTYKKTVKSRLTMIINTLEDIRRTI